MTCCIFFLNRIQDIFSVYQLTKKYKGIKFHRKMLQRDNIDRNTHIILKTLSNRRFLKPERIELDWIRKFKNLSDRRFLKPDRIELDRIGPDRIGPDRIGPDRIGG